MYISMSETPKKVVDKLLFTVTLDQNFLMQKIDPADTQPQLFANIIGTWDA